MSKHNKPHHHSHDRRAQFEASPVRRGGVSPTAVLIAMSLVFGGVLVYLIASGRDGGGGPADVPVMEIAGAGADVSLPVATFADGAARFYRYTTAAGRDVRFFVMKSSDGVVRAAFDACDTCYRDRLGYHQQGDVMVCNKCGRTFRSVDINVLQGGCNPAPLERTVVGDQVVLKAASIALGTTYF
jgi:uncharacterized membrane protein